jgi:carbon storage regulator
MLILNRKTDEDIIIGDNAEIVVKILEINYGNVKIGISAPKNIPVHRREVFEKILAIHNNNEKGEDNE